MIMLDLVLPAWYAEAHDRAWQEYQVAAAQHAKQQAQLREKMSEATDSGPAPTMSSAMTLASFYTGPALPTDPVPTFLARGTDRAMLLPVIHGLLHLLALSAAVTALGRPRHPAGEHGSTKAQGQRSRDPGTAP